LKKKYYINLLSYVHQTRDMINIHPVIFYPIVNILFMISYHVSIYAIMCDKRDLSIKLYF